MVTRVDAYDVYQTLQRTLTYPGENILEPISIIQSPKVYGWPQSQHSTEFLKDFPYNMAPTSRPKGGSTSTQNALEHFFTKISFLSNVLANLTVETQKTPFKLSELFFSCKKHQNSSLQSTKCKNNKFHFFDVDSPLGLLVGAIL